NSDEREIILEGEKADAPILVLDGIVNRARDVADLSLHARVAGERVAQGPGPAGFPIDPPGAHGSVEPETVVDPDVVLPIVEERNPLLEAFAEVDVLKEDIRIRGERLDRGDEAPVSEVVAED